MFLLQLTEELKALDIGILKSVFETRNPVFDIFWIFITNSAAAIAFGIPSILFIHALLKKNKVSQSKALQLLIPVALSAILANILKYTFDLPRPYVVYPFIHKLSVGGSPTFPSGHTADAFAFAVAVSLMVRKWIYMIPVLLWSLLVGYSRMRLGVHFPSDVMAGALVGTLCSVAMHVYTKRRFARQAGSA